MIFCDSIQDSLSVISFSPRLNGLSLITRGARDSLGLGAAKESSRTEMTDVLDPELTSGWAMGIGVVFHKEEATD
jgi:hypothetical protein